MLPTSYRGAATIDGEGMPAELYLDADHIRLRLDDDQEVLRWPIRSVEVDSTRHGDYRLQMGQESFEFAPAVDDGLGDEIALRRRFADPEPPVTTIEHAPTNGSEPHTIADRIREAGLSTPRSHGFFEGLLDGRDFALRTALAVLGAIAVVAVAVAALLGAFDRMPPAPEVGAAATVPSEPAPTTVPVPTTQPPAPATTLPATTTTLTPPTVAPATVTTTPVTTPPATSVWEMTPEDLTVAWDRLVAPLGVPLSAAGLSSGTEDFGFDAGAYVRIEGTLGPEGLVERVVFLGDPSGSNIDDRRVLTALGLTVALVEPDLPPEGRRQLLAALGLDVENPVLAGLDDTLTYGGHDYALRWDDTAQKVRFQVVPSPPADGDS
jgi:hypothetical protein